MRASDVPYLESVEHASFFPIGWLYASVFESLRMRGLVSYTLGGGFILSDQGAKELEEWRTSDKH